MALHVHIGCDCGNNEEFTYSTNSDGQHVVTCEWCGESRTLAEDEINR